MSREYGTFYCVSTPIGNLSDITLRALEVLTSVEVIYAEDTRVSGKLLQRHGIKNKLLSYREAAPTAQVEKRISEVLERLKQGDSLAYITDAGTPGISDPGSFLIRKVQEAGLKVVPIPGPSALTALLSVAGFPAARPIFVGFLPKKKGHQSLMLKLRQALLDEVCDTLVLYESPERIVKLLQELAGWDLPLQVCLGRELTKLYEEILSGTVSEVLDDLQKRQSIKGEISLAIRLYE